MKEIQAARYTLLLTVLYIVLGYSKSAAAEGERKYSDSASMGEFL